MKVWFPLVVDTFVPEIRNFSTEYGALSSQPRTNSHRHTHIQVTTVQAGLIKSVQNYCPNVCVCESPAPFSTFFRDVDEKESAETYDHPPSATTILQQNNISQNGHCIFDDMMCDYFSSGSKASKFLT